MAIATSDPCGVAEPNSSGIKVIIVGLGIAGLAAAIECHRKGHTVIGFEQYPQPQSKGDIMGVAGNGMRIMSRWDSGSVTNAIHEIGCEHSEIDVYSEAGVLEQQISLTNRGRINPCFAPRAGIVQLVYNYAKSLGLDLRFGKQVDGYWETEKEAGIVVGSERIAGDCVIACDGAHSKARRIITGEDAIPLETGSAIFRSFFKTEDIANDPEARWILEAAAGGDRTNLYIAKGVYGLISVMGSGRYVSWSISHRDDGTASTSWVQSVDVKDALSELDKWPAREKIASVIGKTPEGKCLNHQLFSAKPLNTWVSKKARMIIVGDAAHPMLPSTGQGTSQALEDAAVLAICLQLGAKKFVPLSILAAEKIRYARATAVQASSVNAQYEYLDHGLEGTDVEKTAHLYSGNPMNLDYDCQDQAYKEFAKAILAIETGVEYVPTGCWRS